MLQLTHIDALWFGFSFGLLLFGLFLFIAAEPAAEETFLVFLRFLLLDSLLFCLVLVSLSLSHLLGPGF